MRSVLILLNNMKNKDFIFRGFIHILYNADYLTIHLIDGEKTVDLVKKLRAISELFESDISANYFISATKKTDDEMLESSIIILAGGIVADYFFENYSSMSYGPTYETYLQVGEHNLFEEFREHKGKWCVLNISIKNNE